MPTVTERPGSIFDLPPSHSILIHACNTRGSWGAGVAAAFKTHYPAAYSIYREHCRQHSSEELIGTCLLIPPSEEQGARSHWIACLFTSRAYGRKKDSVEEILSATEKSLLDLAKQVGDKEPVDGEMGKCFAVRINSGKFGVPWERTRAVWEGLEVTRLDVTVLTPE